MFPKQHFGLSHICFFEYFRILFILEAEIDMKPKNYSEDRQSQRSPLLGGSFLMITSASPLRFTRLQNLYPFQIHLEIVQQKMQKKCAKCLLQYIFNRKLTK